MAELTWRNIDSPNIDVRNFAIAGNSIGDAFSRMGQVFDARAAQQKTDATDAAKANLLMAANPDELEKLRQQGFNGLDPHVNRAAYAQTLMDQRSALTKQAGENEDLLNKQAIAKTGQAGATYLAALEKGDHATADKIAADQFAQNPDVWGRVAYGYAHDGAPIFDSAQTRIQTAKRDAAQAAYQQGSLANDRSRIGLEGQRLAMTRTEFDQGQEDRKAARLGYTVGSQIAAGIDPKYTPDEAIALARKSDAWKSAGTAAARTAIEAGVKDAYGARIGGTEDDLGAPGEGSLPSFMLPRSPGASAKALRLESAAASGAGQVNLTAKTSTFLGDHPNLRISDRVAGMKDALDNKGLEGVASGIGIDSDALNTLKQQYPGLSNNEWSAIISERGSADPGLFSMRGLKEFASGVRDPIFGVAEGAYRLNTTAQRDLGAAAKEYLAARTQGAPALEKVQLGAATAPVQLVDKALQRALSSADQEAHATGKVSASTAALIQQLRQRELELSNAR